MTQRPAALPLLLGAIPAMLLLGLLLFGVRGVAFAFIEYPLFAQPTVLLASLAPSWADFALAFDWMGLDGFERPRFLSNLVQVGTVRLRWLLHDVGLAHASIGLQWVFALVGVPFGALAARRLLGPGAAAPAALALLTSVGVLSHVLMLFHPAKAIAFAAAAAILWIATSAHARPWRAGAWAGALAFLGMNGDETALLGALLPAFLVPGLLSRRAVGYWLAQIPFGLAFLAWVFWGAPAAVAAAGQPPFDMLAAMTRYAGTNISRSATTLADLPAMIGSNLLTFLAHAVSPLSDLAVAALEVPGAREPVLIHMLEPLYPISPTWGSPVLLLLIGTLPVALLVVGAAWLGWRRREAWPLRVLLALLLCAVLLAVLMRVPASGQFYYGAIATLPVALLLAWIWTRTAPRPLLGGLAALWIGLAGIANATYQTAQWQVWGQEQPRVHPNGWPADPVKRPKWLQAEDRIAERRAAGQALLDAAAADPALARSRVGIAFRVQDLFERPTFLTEIDNAARPPACDLCILPPGPDGGPAPATLWRGAAPSGAWADALFLFDCRPDGAHADACRNTARGTPPEPRASWLPDDGRTLREIFQSRARERAEMCRRMTASEGKDPARCGPLR
jgi:hypothetical protein